MANTPQNSPVLQVKEIGDLYSRGNFQTLAKYFQDNNQLLGFKFFEITFAKATTNQLVAHNLGYVPQDVIVTQCTGAGVVSVNYGTFDTKNISLTATGSCRVRLFVGTYWNFTSNVNNDTKAAQIINPVPTVTNVTSGFLNPMNAGGDMIYGGTTPPGTPTRLPNGAVGQTIISSGTILPPTWGSPSVTMAGDVAGPSGTNAIKSSVNLGGAPTVTPASGGFSGLALGAVTAAAVAQGQLAIIYGSIAAAGAINFGSGFTVTGPTGSVYTINFTKSFSAAPVVVATIAPTGNSPIVTLPAIYATTVSSCNIVTYTTGPAGFNTPFHFIAIGPK